MILAIVGCSQSRLFSIQSSESPTTLSLHIKNLCPSDGYSLRATYGMTLSAILQDNRWAQDWDRDGLTDDFERSASTLQNFNISWTALDTDVDGFDDLWMYKNNVTYTALQSAIVTGRPCDVVTKGDPDLDLVNTCMENALRTDAALFDTDGDAIPDGLEYRYGLNPLDARDADLDPDDDGFTNLEEVQRATRLNVSNTAAENSLSIRYNSKSSTSTAQPGVNCREMWISNLPVKPVENGNLYQVMIVESKMDQPNPNGTMPQRLRSLTILVPQDKAGTLIVDAEKYLRPSFPNTMGSTNLLPLEWE